MRQLLLATTAAVMAFAAPALAQSLSDRLVAEYQAQGYTYIEVYQGLSQIKVEATKGNTTIEVVYDAATGAILYTDIDPADAEEMSRQGVEFNVENRDFTNDDDDDDDRRDDDDDRYDDDDHDDDHGSDDDDDHGGDDDSHDDDDDGDDSDDD